MKKVLFNVAIFCVMIVLFGCSSSNEKPKPSVLKQEDIGRSISFDSMKTVGNYSYLPINQSGNPGDFHDTILAIMNKFEMDHPGLKVTSWKIEKKQGASGVSAFIYGLWVDHEPRPQ